MPHNERNRLLRPETLTAIGLALLATLLLIPTAEYPKISALLPAAMLISLLVLAAIMLLLDQRRAARGEAAAPMVKAPARVLAAFILVVVYAIAVDFIGFYPSTALSVPLVAFAFGYRRPLGLAVATAIVLAAMYLIFSCAMSKDFPTGHLWSLLS